MRYPPLDFEFWDWSTICHPNPYPAETKVIILCHQCRARPACTSVLSDQAIYYWLTNFKFSSWVLILISLKMIMDSSKNGKWIIPFNRLIVNVTIICFKMHKSNRAAMRMSRKMVAWTHICSTVIMVTNWSLCIP